MHKITGKLISSLLTAALIFTSYPQTADAAVSEYDVNFLVGEGAGALEESAEALALPDENVITEDDNTLIDDGSDFLIESENEEEVLLEEAEMEALLSEEDTIIAGDGVTPASGSEEGTNITWSLAADGTLTLSGTGATRDYNKSSGGAPTISDRPWHSYRSQVTKLVVGNGITRIGHRAFQGFSTLGSAVLPDSLTSIGQWAFQNCTALTDASVPAGVTLENGAFDNTPVMKEIAATENEKYKSSEYYKKLCQVSLTGNYRDDVITIAKSQIGYHEGDSEADYGGDNTNGSNNYSEYGRFLNSQGNAWCSEFASWCVRMAGLPESRLKSSAGANANTFTNGTSAKYYDWSQTIYAGGSYTPGKGDIILWVWSGFGDYDHTKSLSHTTLIDSVDVSGSNVTFHVVHGNSDEQVGLKDFTVNKADGLYGSSGKIGYFVAPDYDTSVSRKTVTFNPDGGNVSPASKKLAADSLYGPMPIPTRDGYDFDGWFDGSKRINIYSPFNAASDKTLTAHWKEGSGEAEEPADTAIPAEFLRTGADETSIKLYNESLEPKELGNGVYSQLFTYKAGGKSYTALYIRAEKAGGILNINARIHGDDLYGNDLAKKVITDVIMDDNIETIEPTYFFEEMKKVSYVRLSGTLKEMGGDCFHGCSSIPEITIPKTLVTAGYNTFGGCESLKTVIFENGIKKIPASICSVGNGVSSGHIETVMIPPSVTEIDNNAFRSQERLTRVIFTDPSKTTLARIGNEAFYGTYLDGITLPKFGGKWDTGIPHTPLQKPVIENMAFGGINNPSFEKLIIPEGVTRLGQINNSGNKFKEIYLPNTFADEGLYYAFSAIDYYLPTLEHIYFAGSKAQFIKAYYPGTKESDLKEYGWYNKMVFNHGAPTLVSSIKASETTIVKYLDDITEGMTDTIELTISPVGHLDADYKAVSTDVSVAEPVTVGPEAEGKLPLTLKYHRVKGEADITVSGGLASETIKVVIKDKDPAAKPYIKVLSGTGSDYGDQIDLRTATPGAQIFYVLDSNEVNTTLNGINIRWDADSKRYISKSSSIIEYTRPLVIGKDTGAVKNRLHAVSLKNGFAISEILNKELGYADEEKYLWGDVALEDRVEFTTFSDIPDGVWAPKSQLKDPSIIYTGNKITIPNLRVYFKNRLLTDNKDYTLNYSNNINAGEGNIRVKLTGNYSGAADLKFSINMRKVTAADISNGDVTCSVININAKKNKDGSYARQNPVPKFVVFGRTLKAGVDYHPTFKKSTESYYVEGIADPGIYSISIAQAFTPPINYDFTGIRFENVIHCISSESIPAGKLTVSKIPDQDIKDWSEKGYKVTPGFTVTYKGQEPVEGIDGNYTYKFEHNDKAGTASLTVIGTGKTVPENDFVILGSKTVTFKIKGIPFNKDTVGVEGLNLKPTYTGKEADPSESAGFRLTYNGRILNKGSDYNVIFNKDHTNAGKVKMTVKGDGIYEGSVVYNLDISPVPLNGEKIRVLDKEGKEWNESKEVFQYSVNGVEPSFTVQMFDGTKWVDLSADNYKVKFVNNKAKADYNATGKNGKSTAPAIIISGKKNSSGSLTKRFTIRESDIGSCDMSIDDMVFANKAGIFSRKPVITDDNGARLKAGKDYDKKFEYKYAEDVIVTRVSGKGKKAVRKEVLRTSDQPVEKADIIPVGAVIKVTARGKKNYDGTITGTFTVAASPIKNLKFEVKGGPYTYTGKPVTPGKSDIRVSVRSGKKWVVLDDAAAAGLYKIEGYANNVSKGKKARILIKAKGGYAGTTSVKFSIGAAR